MSYSINVSFREEHRDPATPRGTIGPTEYEWELEAAVTGENAALVAAAGQKLAIAVADAAEMIYAPPF